MIWRGRGFEFLFPRRTLLMGIVNVTPDSFADGGKYLGREAAVAHALTLAEEGADILDIGGESTRPGAISVTAEEEMGRIIPVIEQLVRTSRVPISVDTRKADVAEAALKAGAVIVNDIAGNREDMAMWEVVKRFEAGYVLMHMRGTPENMTNLAQYDDVTTEVTEFFSARLAQWDKAGLKREQVVLDPGIGFAKETKHNLQLLANLPKLKTWDRPLLIGVSRKSFIGQTTGSKDASLRLPGSLACACWAVAAGAGIIRTHDVAETRQAIQMTEAILEKRE